MFVTVPFFIFLLGSVPLVALAQEASSVLEGEESATIDFREKNDTEFEELPIFGELKTTEGTFVPQFGDLKTTESAVDGESENATAYEVNTEGVDGKRREEPEGTDEGGLGTVALVGIIIGIIVAVGILAGIVIAVVRKMSGRYSP